LPEEEEEPLWQKFLDKLKEPMIALLMCSAGISLLTGQYHDALSIFIVR
jgi:Ca2+-transporting ATPase